MSIDYPTIKREILSNYGTTPPELFDGQNAIRKRIDYLKTFLKRTDLNGFVLGISGGVDSYVAGALAQKACDELTAEGRPSFFYAVRLPAGTQRDEGAAQDSLVAMGAKNILTINIGQASTDLDDECNRAISQLTNPLSPKERDYHKGNIKARMRMIAQYHLAAHYQCAVIGTDHASEAVTGFYTKHGDGACDLLVLNGLSKNNIRTMATLLNAPQHIAQKPPTADLEELNPGKLDDEGFGFPYSKLSDFLDGKNIDEETERKIIDAFVKTRHKRDPVVTFVS